MQFVFGIFGSIFLTCLLILKLYAINKQTINNGDNDDTANNNLLSIITNITILTIISIFNTIIGGISVGNKLFMYCTYKSLGKEVLFKIM